MELPLTKTDLKMNKKFFLIVINPNRVIAGKRHYTSDFSS